MEINPIEIANSQDNAISRLTADIQSKIPNNPNTNVGGLLDNEFNIDTNLAGGMGIKNSQNKPSFEEYIPISEGYDLVGDDWMSRFPSYKKGRDNAEFAAQTQDTWDKVGNGLTKAGANLLTTVVGNTVGIVYGAANGVKEGSFNAVFDNNFSNYLADYNEKLGYQLPNYVSKQEREEGFFGSLNNANFWANDVAGGLSFTLGTVVSEAIWSFATGGAGNIAKAGLRGAQSAGTLRFGKSLLGAEGVTTGLANWKKLANSATAKLFMTGGDDAIMASATSASNRAKWLNTARFIATTSGNEAGIEALHYKREMKENFYNTFESRNGREPSAEEVADFENELENSANLVFATNMAILAPSNLALFGSTFNVASPFRGVSRTLNKSLFGVGTEATAEGGFRALTATAKQRVGRIAYAVAKPLVTEGLWEEGLQGVTTKTAKNWITAGFDPKYNNENMALSDATYKAFAEQYGTKEGWKEIGIGMIIGAGSSLVLGRGKFEEVREFERAEQRQSQVATGMNQFATPAAMDIMAKRMIMNNRVRFSEQEKVESAKKGDDVGARLADDSILISSIQFRDGIGEDLTDLGLNVETALRAQPEQTWGDAGITDKEQYIADTVAGVDSTIKSYKKAKKFADAVLGETRILGQNIQTELLKDALTHQLVSGEKANVYMDNLLQEMSAIIGTDSTKAKSIQMELQRLGKNKQAQVRKINKDITQADSEVATLTAELQRLQVSKDETKGERLQSVQQRLTEALDRQALLKTERESLAQEVSQESKRRRGIQGTNIGEISLTTDFITGEDLATIEEKLQKIEATIKSYKGVNHEVYYDLLDLQAQYNSAKEKFFGYQNAIDAIVSGKFAPNFSKVRGLLGKIFMQGNQIDDFTKEFLEEMNTNYQNTLGRTGVDIELEAQYITDEDYNQFQETGEVSQEIKEQLAERVKSKEILSSREKEIYDVFINEVNSLTAINPNKPDLSQGNSNRIEIGRLQQEKLALEQELEGLISSLEESITARPAEARIPVTSSSEVREGDILYDANNIKGTVTSLEQDSITIQRDNGGILTANPKFVELFRESILTPDSEQAKVEGIRETMENIASGIEGMGSNMIQEYARRIKDGESFESVTEGLPQSFIDGINLELGRQEIVSPQENNTRKKEIEKQLRKIDKRISELSTNEETLTDAQRLRRDLSDAMKRDYPLITTDVDELIKGRPTQDELDRYIQLYRKGNLDLFEQRELEELQPRMQKWFMAQSLPSVDGMSVADVAELIDQLETQVDTEETLTEITAEDVLNSTEIQDSREVNNEKILQNLSGSAVAKIVKDKIYFAQIDARNLLGKLIQNGASIVQVQTVTKKGKLNTPVDLTTSLLNTNYDKPGTKFQIGDVSVEIGERGNIVMDLESYNRAKDIINLYYFDSRTGKWSWADLYEKVDGQKIKKASEYITNTTSDFIYNVTEGEDLTLYVDMTTPWNKDLIDEAMQEVADKDILSEETKDNIRKTLEITSQKERENNSTLKSTQDTTVDDNFMLIRKRFADKFIDLMETEGVATLPKKIDLVVEVPVSEIFLGTPDFILDANNQPIELPITTRGIEEVISQGYVLGQDTVLADKKINMDGVSRLFISNLARTNPAMKIPVVLLRKGSHQFLFPISLIKTAQSQVEKLDMILNSAEDFIQLRKEVNNLLISLGSDTRLVEDSDLQLENIRTELENYTTNITADQLASVEYDKNNLAIDATIKIDLEDTLISSPKITVDFTQSTIGTVEENRMSAVDLRKDIVQEMVEIDKIIKATPELPDQGRFLQVFDNNDVSNQGSDIMNRKDVNFIRDAFFKGTDRIAINKNDTFVKAVGKDRLLRLRGKLEMLDFYENQIKTIKDKETTRKLNCK